MRLLSRPASSGNVTTGSPSTISASGGWGRESRSLKNGEDKASTDLWTRNLTWSDDRTIIFASGISKHNGTDGGLACSEVVSSLTRVKVESAYGVFVLAIAMRRN